jgi:hypothetical protein
MPKFIVPKSKEAKKKRFSSYIWYLTIMLIAPKGVTRTAGANA